MVVFFFYFTYLVNEIFQYSGGQKNVRGHTNSKWANINELEKIYLKYCCLLQSCVYYLYCSGFPINESQNIMTKFVFCNVKFLSICHIAQNGAKTEVERNLTKNYFILWQITPFTDITEGLLPKKPFVNKWIKIVQISAIF